MDERIDKRLVRTLVLTIGAIIEIRHLGCGLQQLLRYRLRFVVRWQKHYKLVDTAGESRKAWEICRGKRSLAHRLIWDASRNCERKIGIYYTQVSHPDFPNTPLWLVVSRQGKGRSPWYLLTNQPVDSVDHAFSLIRAYARRW